MPPPARYKGISVNSKGESVNIRKIYCAGTLLKEKSAKEETQFLQQLYLDIQTLGERKKLKSFLISVYIPYFHLSRSLKTG